MLQYVMAHINSRIEVSEEGQGLVEYALILALIAVVVATILLTLEDEITGTFQEVIDGLNSGG